jgi:hypothetical protein
MPVILSACLSSPLRLIQHDRNSLTPHRGDEHFNPELKPQTMKIRGSVNGSRAAAGCNGNLTTLWRFQCGCFKLSK